MSFEAIEASEQRPVAFCGMGLLGSNFSRRLLERGVAVRVYNRTASRAQALGEEGAQVAQDLAACARGASRVHLTLRSDASVQAVLEGLSAGVEPGDALVVVDHTTTSAQGAAQRHEDWAPRGLHYVHAPVFMGPQNARDATGYMLIGGPRAEYEQLKPLLEPMTGSLWYVGEPRDKAAALKLIGNQMLMSITATLADSMALAKAHGLARTDIEALLEAFPVGASFGRRLERLCSVDFEAPSWELQMARKDADLMQARCQKARQPLLLLDALAQAMDAQIDAGHAEADWTICAKTQLGR